MKFSPPDDEDPLSEEDSKVLMNIDAWIERLRQADRSFYNLLALEVWSIAKTMDGLIPGFWHRFMENRQVSLKNFMKQKQAAKGDNGNSPDAPDHDTPAE